MKQNLLKFAQIAVGMAAAVGTGIIISVLLLSISIPPKKLAAFKAWEAQQARQKGHGCAQGGEATP